MAISKLVLKPASKARGTIVPPGSKSVANRVLPIAALAKGGTQIFNVPDGEDVRIMLDSLLKLGTDIRKNSNSIHISGNDGPFRCDSPVQLNLGNSGTSSRFLTALLSAGHGSFSVDGIPRLRERPVGHLTDALSQFTMVKSADDSSPLIRFHGKPGYPPYTINARGLSGGTAHIKGSASSQFLSGLLMVLPLTQSRSTAYLNGPLVSQPYVQITLDIMSRFGACVHTNAFSEFTVKSPHGYQSPGRYIIEPDASNASYFLAAGAIAGESITVPGIGRNSLQFKSEGKFAEVLQAMGAHVSIGETEITVKKGELHGIEIDMDTMTDTGMTLAVAALFAKGPTTIKNIGNWRIKETDRLSAMATELSKLGAEVTEGKDFLTIRPPRNLKSATLDTYNDHRMAMSLALACFGQISISILNPQCTSKTYPDFFKDFNSIVCI